MGILSSKKKIYVASTAYKMVDDDTPRATFMQETLSSSVLSGSDRSLGEAIVNAHLGGPRSTQRSFFRWAKRNFDFGMPRARIDYTTVVDHDVVAQHIHSNVLGSDSDATVNIQSAYIDTADEGVYAEQYILEHRPELIALHWAADYNTATDEIQIQYPPGTEYPEGTSLVTDTFAVAGFNTSQSVMSAYYTVDRANSGTTDPAKLYIYVLGTGSPDIDAFEITIDSGTGDVREFYPFIPIRIDNESVFDDASPAHEHEEIIRDAYKKSMGGEIDDLLEEVEGNDSIDDIDYAYVVFGVTLNDKTKSGRRYILEFLRTLMNSQVTTEEDYVFYEEKNNASGNQTTENSDGSEKVNTSGSNISGSGLIDGVARASESTAPQISSLHLTLPNDTLGVVDMRISWAHIAETRETGVMAKDAKVGDIDVFLGEKYKHVLEVNAIVKFPIVQEVGKVTVRHQVSTTEYVELTATGLLHKNLIYKGKSVDILGHKALEEEDDSGFIFPLHEPTMRRMGLVNSTEFSRQCQIIVFNSYEVVKVRFYERGIFKVFVIVAVVVAIVVLAVVTGGVSLGPSSPILGGVLGSSAAIGAALGFSGLLAIAVGTAVNVIAAMIITQLISTVAVEVFGEKFGRIIALIASVALTIYSTGGNLSNFTSNLASIGTIDKLLLLTNAATELGSIYTQGQIEKYQGKIEDITEDYNEEIDRLKEAYEALGFGDRVIDPIMLTDFSNVLMGEDFVVSPNNLESVDSFLTRTLMSGSDIIDMSLGMVNDFVDVSLTLS